jgi:hypothetical protein
MICAVGRCLQSFPFRYDDVTSRQPDHSPLFKVIKSDCDPSSPDTKHQRQKLVGERNLIASQTVIGHEQPARQPLLKSSGAIRESGIRSLV